MIKSCHMTMSNWEKDIFLFELKCLSCIIIKDLILWRILNKLHWLKKEWKIANEFIKEKSTHGTEVGQVGSKLKYWNQ